MTTKRTIGHSHQCGFSLIELLVALAINLVIITAAAYLYLGTSQSRRELDQVQEIKDNGQYALDLIGRDIVNAGFYPVARLGVNLLPQGYTNVIAGAPEAYNFGVYGCKAQNFKVIGGSATSWYLCANHSDTANTADSLIISYFTNDAMGKDIGHATTCTGTAIVSNTAAATPAAPQFVSNRYTLGPVSTTIESSTVNTYALRCAGVTATGGNSDQPSVMGIEQLQFRYGVYTDEQTLQPDRFYRADEMAALGTVPVSNILSSDKTALSAWGRVTAIEVCLVARGLQATKQVGAGGTATSYTDCAGDTITPTDRIVRRMYRKIYAVRNNLPLAIGPSS